MFVCACVCVCVCVHVNVCVCRVQGPKIGCNVMASEWLIYLETSTHVHHLLEYI